jgi:hypothetical protein
MTAYLQERTLYSPLIATPPSLMLGLVVVIPCHDEDFLLLSLMSLWKCEPPPCDTEVIVVINDAEDAAGQIKAKNRKTYEQATRWAEQNLRPRIRLHLLYMSDLPRKHAGVGLARKIGMDEATFRLEKVRNPGGVIACFDADSRCEKNYLTAIYQHFQANPKTQACSIYFEHPLEGAEFGEDVYDAITLYELHLRYYVQAQRWAGFPYAFQTIGSSMAVRCNAYQQQGGMNRRQAGEDFYFLHKFTPLGHFSEIIVTKVIPSPRPSHRVPFGTGRAVGDILKGKGRHLTYNPQSFKDLRQLFGTGLPAFFEAPNDAATVACLPESVQTFLATERFEEKLAEIRSNTANRESFRRRFFRWFDAFAVMKFVHHCREHFYPDVEVTAAAEWLLEITGKKTWQEKPDKKQLLLIFRQLDKAAT